MKLISEVTNEDNMAMMSRYPDKFFDLAIVDPPYGIKRLSVKENRDPNTKFRRSMAKMVDSTKSWNNIKPDNIYIKELQRVSKFQIIWGANNFTLPESEYFIVWDKFQSVPNFASAEYAWTNCKVPAKVFRYSIHQHNCDKGENIHPTMKPIKLYTWLLQNYAKKGFKILDTHLGSASSRIAAYDLGFDFYGCELDKDYYEASCKRFNTHIAQQKLFAPTNNNAEQISLL